MATFSYSEAIDNRYLRHIKPEFSFANTLTNEAKLIRLLVGTLRVTNIYSTDSFDQFNNYSILGIPENIPVSTRPLTNCLTNQNINNLCEYLDKTKYLNSDFFLHLLEELTCYFYKKSRASYTICFLHLYRSLEYISYSFPLIYASISREYHGSFNKLKNFFVDGSKNELLFFDEFVKKLLETSSLETPLLFEFNTLSADLNRNHYNIIRSILTDQNIDSQVQNVSITTSYQHLIKLTIDLRNRYFHFAVGGQRNIKAIEIIESDIFFQRINEEILNWIAIIYFEILTNAVDK